MTKHTLESWAGLCQAGARYSSTNRCTCTGWASKYVSYDCLILIDELILWWTFELLKQTISKKERKVSFTQTFGSFPPKFICFPKRLVQAAMSFFFKFFFIKILTIRPTKHNALLLKDLEYTYGWLVDRTYKVVFKVLSWLHWKQV